MHPLFSSRRRRFLAAVLGLALAVAGASAAWAAVSGYALDWFDFSGGGGTSMGGDYSLSGTAGQPDAGTLSGGDYSLLGGYWGAAAAPVFEVYVPVVQR